MESARMDFGCLKLFKQAKATKLGDFFQNLSGNSFVWKFFCLLRLMLPCHGNHFLTSAFIRILKFQLFDEKTSFFEVHFKFFDHFRVIIFSIILITTAMLNFGGF